MYLSVDPIFHLKLKHISIDYHFMRDHVTKGSFVVFHISSKNQLVDVLTKLLLFLTFCQLCSKISFSNESSILPRNVIDNG